jgi:multidrug resistance efflux pump
MKKFTIIGIAIALIAVATGIGWLYYQADPAAWDAFQAELAGDAPSAQPVRGAERPSRDGDNLVASGNIEADEITIAAEIGGRAVLLHAEEGDLVSEGSRLLQLDQSALLVQLEGAEALVTQARAAKASTEAQLALAKSGATGEEIAGAEASILAAEGAVAAAEAALRSAEIVAERARTLVTEETSVAIAEAGVAEAKGAVAMAEAGLALAAAERARLTSGPRAEEISLYEALLLQANSNYLYVEDIHLELIDNEIGGRPEERARFQSESARGARDAAQAQLDLVRAGLLPAELAAADAAISAAESQVTIAQAGVAAAEAALEGAETVQETSQDEVAIAENTVAAAAANVVVAEGQLAAAEAMLAQLIAGATAHEIAILEAQVTQSEAAVATAIVSVKAVELEIGRSEISAPVDGIILQRLVQAGELAVPGAPLFTLADLRRVTLTVYVPEAELGRVSLGQSVDVTVDAYDNFFPGQVTHIASQAEFTPRNVQTQEERVHMVFAVKVTLENADLRLKPGMPADAEFK